MADPFTRIPREEAPLIHIGNGAVIGIGASIMAPRQGLTVGDGTWVGANAVLLESTGPGEVWAGVPARRIR
jgi:serine O-acetyltransferase